MKRSDFFKDYPPPPEDISASNVIARMIDGLGYRLYVSLDGLTEEECTILPPGGGKTIDDAIWHIWGLVNWVRMHIVGEQMTRPESYLDQGWATLAELETLRQFFIDLDDSELENYKLEDRPWWMFVNMPLADAIHHEGEVRLLRMQIGNPAE